MTEMDFERCSPEWKSGRTLFPKVLGYWYNSVSEFQFILPQCRCVKDKTTGIRRSNVVRKPKKKP